MADDPVSFEDDESSGPNASMLVGLQTLLVDRYADLKLRLVRRLGSHEWAEEALQDTYLRLGAAEVVGSVQNPTAYLFRTALNMAISRVRAEKRRLSASDVQDLLHIADDAPNALRIFEGRADILRLKAVMAKLPPRQRAILLAVRLEGAPRQDIADRFGISVSMVEKELRQAQEYCVARFGRQKA